jgi:O-antigen/teichoic acid export membrane protein
LSVVRRLYRVGSLGELMGIHVSVTVLQRLLGLIRVLVLAWMLEPEHMSLWGLGAMIFTVLGPLMTLGADSGTERYVSLFETRGRLELFYRRMRLGVLALVLLAGLALLMNAEGITAFVIAVGKGVSGVTWDEQVTICWLSLLNAMLWALHLNVLSFLKGMRVYRVVSVVHILFSVLFTAMSVGVLWFWPTATAALVTHAISLGISMIVALGFLHFGIVHTGGHKRHGGDRRKEPRPGQVDRRAPKPEKKLPRNLFARLATFGLISVLGTALWSVNSYISFYMVFSHQELDKSNAGVFFVFMRLAYPVVLLAQAAWAVLFVHVAKRWEAGHRDQAISVLETAYKGIAVAIMTLAVIVYATAPYWVLILESRYHGGVELVGPLMMSFLSIAFMALMTMLARLNERPAVIAAAAVLSGVANVLLGNAWIGPHDVTGAAYAAGVGMFLGVGVVSGAYLLTARERLHWSTITVLLLPAILLLPPWAAVAGWSAAVAVMLTTPLVFSREQKKTLIEGIKTVGNLTRRNGA